MKLYTPYFIYNGVDSRMMDIIVTAMPPTVRAAKRLESITVPGRDGSLHETDGAYDNYTKTIECAIKDRKKIDEIAAWLTGSGNIIFSSEPDKVYKVSIVNTIPITQMMKTFQKFQVNFDTYPFKYSVNAYGDAITLTKASNVLNKGTVYSRPIFKIYGSGVVTLTVNGKDYPISSIDGYITINSEVEECYKDDVNCNHALSADSFPVLSLGANSIRWTGNVSKIEITPNWRWL